MPTRLRRSRPPRVLVASLAALLVGSVLAASTTANAAPTRSDGPTYQMPSVGECHQMAYVDWFGISDATAPVKCSKKHNALVIAVRRVPDKFDFNTEHQQIWKAYDKYCVPAYYKTLGKPAAVIARTAYLATIWAPTPEQQDHGARWIRCDLNLKAYKSLVPLARAPFFKGSDVPAGMQTCLMIRKGRAELSTCTSKHNYAVAAVLDMPFKKSPSRAAALKYAAQHCKTYSDDWWATWRSGATYAYGDHTMTCYQKVG